MAQAPTPKQEWLTVAEAADYLRLSRDTLYRWAKQGKIALYKVGGTATRVRKSDLDALAHRQTPPSDSWSQLSAPAFDTDWDHPEDAIYDNWQELYGLSKG